MKAKRLYSTLTLSHEEWLERRVHGVGGSEISAIMGKNPWQSSLSLYRRKIGEPLEPEETREEVLDRFYWGHVHENSLRERFKERTGLKCEKRNCVYQSYDHPWALANIDGLVVGGEEPLVWEAKTTSEYNASAWESGNVPEHYVLQVQWYLGVGQLKGAWVSVLIGGNRDKHIFIERDDDLIKTMFDVAGTFWQGVQSKTPPKPDDTESYSESLKQLYPSSKEDKTIHLDERYDFRVQHYLEHKSELKALKKKVTEFENLIQDRMGDSEKCVFLDGHKATWKTQQGRPGLDKQALEIDYPGLLDKYTVRGKPFRSFRFK